MVRTAALALLLSVLSSLVALAQAEPTADVELRGRPGETLTEVDPGQRVTVYADIVLPESANTSFKVHLNGSIGDEIWDPAQQTFREGGAHNVSAGANVPQDAEDAVTVSYEIAVLSIDTSDENATWVKVADLADTFTVQVFAPEVPPAGPPLGPIIGVVALVVLAGVAVGVYAKRRRPRQIRGEAPRSRALQELEREKQEARGKRAEPATPVAPPMHPQIKILEARAADVRRIIELASERKARGELTEHQLKTIRAKKEAELQKIEEEMAQFRGG